jgi:hypothetical protein
VPREVIFELLKHVLELLQFDWVVSPSSLRRSVPGGLGRRIAGFCGQFGVRSLDVACEIVGILAVVAAGS